MKEHQTFRIEPEYIKKAKALAKLDRRKLSNYYEIAVMEKIEREQARVKRLSKEMNK